MKSNNKCSNCGNDFESLRQNHIYCCRKCKTKGNYGSQKISHRKYLDKVKDTDEYKRNNIERSTKQYKEYRESIDAYKLEHGCVDCGYNEYACALHFDHIGKEKNILISMCRNTEKIKREIELCELVCANCHAIRTENRRSNNE